MVSKTNIKTSIKVYNVNDLEKKKKKIIKIISNLLLFSDGIYHFPTISGNQTTTDGNPATTDRNKKTEEGNGQS